MDKGHIKFFDRKGAMEVVVLVSGGKPYERIVKEATVSRATVSNRLDEGLEYGLFRREPLSKDQRFDALYTLDDLGVYVDDLLEKKMIYPEVINAKKKIRDAEKITSDEIQRRLKKEV